MYRLPFQLYIYIYREREREASSSTIRISFRLDWANFPMRLAFGIFSTGQWVMCTIHKTYKLSNSAIFSSKLGPMILFTYLKIILL